MAQRGEADDGCRARSSTSAKPGVELDPAELAWERPGGSRDRDDGGDAVEIAPLPGGGYAMRSGADGPDGPVLFFTRAEWRAFVRGVRDGEFRVDRLD